VVGIIAEGIILLIGGCTALLATIIGFVTYIVRHHDKTITHSEKIPKLYGKVTECLETLKQHEARILRLEENMDVQSGNITTLETCIDKRFDESQLMSNLILDGLNMLIDSNHDSKNNEAVKDWKKRLLEKTETRTTVKMT